MKFITAILLLLLSTNSWGAIAWVTFNTVNMTNASGATNVTLSSFTGNVIVVGVCWINTAAGTGPTITDNQSHTYTQVGSTVVQNAVSAALFTTAVNYVTQPTQGTVTWGTGAGFASAVFGNLSGVAAYGNAATNSGNGTTGGATITTQDANNWLVNIICSGGTGSHSNGTGTRRSTGGQSPGDITTMGTNTVAGAGSLTMSVTISTAQDFAVKGIELRTVAPSTFAANPSVIVE